VNRKRWLAAGVGAAVSAVANPAIRKGYWQLHWAVDGVVRNPPMEWMDQDTGQVAETERMTRRMRWTITRPMWTRKVGTVALSCGCGRRVTGRMAWFAADCPKHSSSGAYGVGRKEFLERADWDDVSAVVVRLTEGIAGYDTAVFTDLLHDHSDMDEVKALTAALVRWLAEHEEDDEDA
jgi:hypothetical protein